MTGNSIVRALSTHHVDDLLQSQPELELDGLGLVVDRPLQLVVLLHQRVQQPPLRFPAIHLQQHQLPNQSIIIIIIQKLPLTPLAC